MTPSIQFDMLTANDVESSNFTKELSESVLFYIFQYLPTLPDYFIICAQIHSFDVRVILTVRNKVTLALYSMSMGHVVKILMKKNKCSVGGFFRECHFKTFSID